MLSSIAGWHCSRFKSSNAVRTDARTDSTNAVPTYVTILRLSDAHETSSREVDRTKLLPASDRPAYAQPIPANLKGTP